MTHEEYIYKHICQLAQRIYDIDPYEAQDNDDTPETIATTIKEDPLYIIEYLINIVEDLQA